MKRDHKQSCKIISKQIVLCCEIVRSQKTQLFCFVFVCWPKNTNCDCDCAQKHNLWICENSCFAKKIFYDHVWYSLFMNKTDVEFGKKSAFWYRNLKKKKIFGHWTKNRIFLSILVDLCSPITIFTKTQIVHF